MDWSFAIVNGVACAATFGFAAHVVSGRREAMILSALLFANWAQYVLSWTPYNPTEILYRAGLPIEGNTLWMLIDAIIGSSSVVIAFRFWWGWALWLSSIAQLFLHAGYKDGLYDFQSYSSCLDWVLKAQIAVFFLIGGRGVRDRLADLHRFLDERRVHGRRSASSTAREAAGGQP